MRSGRSAWTDHARSLDNLHPMHGLFVTGTDTGVGKTCLAAGIAGAWRRQGRVFRVCKPVATGAEGVPSLALRAGLPNAARSASEGHDPPSLALRAGLPCEPVATGAEDRGGRLVSPDTLALARAAGDDDLRAITPWVFALPAAPPVAARQVGETLRLDELAAAVRRRQVPGGAILVEGVGGLLCPLTERETVIDLAAELGLPLVVAARRSLGTLNHTLLTLEAARSRGLSVAGVVVVETTPVRDAVEANNVEELRRWGVPLLGVVAHQPGPLPEVPALPPVDWWGLAHSVGV